VRGVDCLVFDEDVRALVVLSGGSKEVMKQTTIKHLLASLLAILRAAERTVVGLLATTHHAHTIADSRMQ